jgi:hypothetical protein
MSKRREYNIWKDGWVAVNYDEWVAAVKTGNRASIVQILGRFGADRNFLQVCTGLSNRRNHPPGEWESRVRDCYLIDLVNPLYCRGSIEAIEAMHARALSIARQWRRNYVERPVHYSENLLGLFGEEGCDPRYLAKNPDFAVDYFEEDRENDDFEEDHEDDD